MRDSTVMARGCSSSCFNLRIESLVIERVSGFDENLIAGFVSISELRVLLLRDYVAGVNAVRLELFQSQN